ncbi:FIG00652081: hypothetical protein [hydrothermal vent metagenome]|uniref:Lipoprotein n=1 Tax=hydrothermal vent metagenome TaxID=652676 RepID=A0A3B0T922_9ZZZZ
MKIFFKSAMYASLLVVALSFTSCQKESPVDVQLDDEQTLVANSATAKLIERTVSNDGSFDNIVDGSSCFDIRFPYTVEVNGLEITINSEQDLELIEKIFDALENDDDILDILFPITITMADYSEITINGVEDLREISEQCIEGGGDDDIECIDVVYPVTLFTYNPNLQETGSVTVDSDKELRRFFAGLSETDIIGIDFPVVFEMYDGTKVTVNSNSELAQAIERAKEACDEDDDNDYNDDDFNKERLDNLLVECPWLVKEIKRNDQDNSEQYADYLLNFDEDGSVVARDRAGNVLNGEWSTRVSDYRVLLKLEFETLVDFTLEWFVYDIDGERIKLHAGDGNKIIMKSACGYEVQECSENFIKETLKTCKWEASNGESSFLDDLTIDFSNMDIHVNGPNMAVDEGSWAISGTTLTFSGLSTTLANYVGEWEVVECSARRFKLKRGDDYLVLEKECE